MKLLITTSTFPAHDHDPVPDFVQKQAVYLKIFNPSYRIYVHAPHNFYSRTWQSKNESPNKPYHEVRYHYFYPRRFELLAGRGILPALKHNKWLYLQIPFFFLFHGLSLFHVARKIKPDVIYAHWFTPQAINAAIVSGILNIPFIFTTHAADVSVLKRLPFSEKLVKWVCHKSAAYTAVSERTVEKLASFFSTAEWQDHYARKLKIIPMGIACSPGNNNRFSGSIKHNDGYKQRILFIGRLVEKKGVDCLIRAVAKIHEKKRDLVHLVVAGEGPEKEALVRLSEVLGISNLVEFTGHASGSTKNKLYEQADMVCIPSIVTADGDSEGFPVVLMEALYHGKIIIASNLSGAETLLDDKTNGFVFEATSPDGLKDAILKVTELTPEAKRSISEKARTAGLRYTWDKLIPEYHQLLISASQKVA